MALAPLSPTDPARDTASVLRRIGVIVLTIGLPLAAPLARTGAVVAFVVGAVLLLASAALDGPVRLRRRTPDDLLAAAALVAAGVVVGWAGLSAIWSPVPAVRSVLGVGAILALGCGAYAAIPERMRSANLYPIPIGAGALVLVTLALLVGLWTDFGPERGRQIERSLSVLVLVTWPAVAWLRSRGRDAQAAGLALGTAVVAAAAPGSWPAIALAAGAGAYLLTQAWRRGAGILGFALGLLLLVAPVLLALDRADLLAEAGPWRRALLDEPARLLTGHGFGSMRARADLPGFPGSAVLALWYELGIVGALALAVALATGLAATGDRAGPIAPGQAAAVVTACVLAAVGVGGGALWWPVTVVATALMFTAVRRGQFRTKRPRALVRPEGAGNAA